MADLPGAVKVKVLLAQALFGNPDILLLDEPTNHLDMVSKELLEQALNNYKGTVLYVSHDRYFINQTATRILELTNKEIFQFIGNYDYYLDKKDSIHAASDTYTEQQRNNTETAPSNNKLNWQQQKEQQAQQRKLENEIKKIEDEISALETRNEEVDELLAKEEIYTDVNELLKYNEEKDSIQERLEQLMKKWEDLSQQL